MSTLALVVSIRGSLGDKLVVSPQQKHEIKVPSL